MGIWYMHIYTYTCILGICKYLWTWSSLYEYTHTHTHTYILVYFQYIVHTYICNKVVYMYIVEIQVYKLNTKKNIIILFLGGLSVGSKAHNSSFDDD